MNRPGPDWTAGSWWWRPSRSTCFRWGGMFSSVDWPSRSRTANLLCPSARAFSRTKRAESMTLGRPVLPRRPGPFEPDRPAPDRPRSVLLPPTRVGPRLPPVCLPRGRWLHSRLDLGKMWCFHCLPLSNRLAFVHFLRWIKILRVGTWLMIEVGVKEQKEKKRDIVGSNSHPEKGSLRVLTVK